MVLEDGDLRASLVEKIWSYVSGGYGLSDQCLSTIHTRSMYVFTYHVCNRNNISDKVLEPDAGSELILLTKSTFYCLSNQL